MSLSNRKRLSCPVCRSEALTAYLDVYDDRYGCPGMFNLRKCRACGHKVLFGDGLQDRIADLYTRYYQRSAFSPEQYRPYQAVSGLGAWLDGAFRSAFRWVPENTRVLDIGCGFGQTLGYHKARGCEAYGVEADENVRKVAEKFGLNIHIGLFDPGQYEPNYFDYVTLDQVIEHMTDPVRTMQGVAAVLKSGGYAIVSTPNSNGWGARVFGKRWINWHAPFHLQYFSVASMTITAEKAGLVMEKCRTITSSEWLYYQWLHLLAYPPMGVPSAFWSTSEKLDRGQQFLKAMIGLMHNLKADHIITRFWDMLGWGDNHLYFLKKA